MSPQNMDRLILLPTNLRCLADLAESLAEDDYRNPDAVRLALRVFLDEISVADCAVGVELARAEERERGRQL